MDGARMFELAQALAIAKSRQDVSAALKLFDADMVPESPAFGTRARGLKANAEVLTGSSSRSRITTSCCTVTRTMAIR
jgi:hypothetical protein